MIILKFFYAMMIGVLIAAPIGPVSILCIRYSIKQSFLAGVVVGVGAATGDVIYAVLASQGFDIIHDYFSWAENAIKIVGGIFLLFLSIRALYKERIERFTIEHTKYKQADSYKYIFTISFFTTIFSPMTIMLFMSFFATIELDLTSLLECIIVPIGVFIGTISWMTTMALLLQYVKHKITDKNSYYINFFSNISIACFGFVAIGSVLYSYLN